MGKDPGGACDMKPSCQTMNGKLWVPGGPKSFQNWWLQASEPVSLGRNSQPVKLVSDRPVTLARLLLQAFAVQYPHLAARVIHQSVFLQISGRQAYRGT